MIRPNLDQWARVQVLHFPICTMITSIELAVHWAKSLYSDAIDVAPVKTPPFSGRRERESGKNPSSHRSTRVWNIVVPVPHPPRLDFLYRWKTHYWRAIARQRNHAFRSDWVVASRRSRGHS